MLHYHEVRGKHAQAEFYNCYFNIYVEKRIISCRSKAEYERKMGIFRFFFFSQFDQPYEYRTKK